jgi:hypothetical protein
MDVKPVVNVHSSDPVDFGMNPAVVEQKILMFCSIFGFKVEGILKLVGHLSL